MLLLVWVLLLCSCHCQWLPLLVLLLHGACLVVGAWGHLQALATTCSNLVAAQWPAAC
jgi:hypothetical protein